MTLALLAWLALPASAGPQRKAPVPDLPAPTITQTAAVNLKAAALAQSPHEALLTDFARNFQPGRAWEPQAVSPENAALAQLLQAKAEAINAQVAAERQQLQSLIAGMSHDWKNGLNLIQLSAATIQGHERSVGNIKRAVAGMNDQAMNFLNMAKLDAGRLSVTPRYVALGEVLSEVIDHQQPLLERNENKLVVAGPGTRLFADPAPLSIVLNNLIGNAAKYTRRGTVSVGAEGAAAGAARVFVADTGIGMSPEDVEKIAGGGFHRAANGLRLGQGFGYGMPLVMRLLEAMGTRLEIQSEPAKGSRFSFVLPTAAAP